MTVNAPKVTQLNCEEPELLLQLVCRITNDMNPLVHSTWLFGASVEAAAASEANALWGPDYIYYTPSLPICAMLQ
jgi:hypothetical protein